MSVDNYGGQVRTFAFKQPEKAQEFNQLLRGLIKPGVYEGLTATILTPTTIAIAPGYLAIESNEVNSRKLIQFALTSTLNLVFNNSTQPIMPILSSSLTYYVYATYTWANSIETWLDFGVRLSTDSPITGEVIFFSVHTNGSSQITSITYESTTRGLDQGTY